MEMHEAIGVDFDTLDVAAVIRRGLASRADYQVERERRQFFRRVEHAALELIGDYARARDVAADAWKQILPTVEANARQRVFNETMGRIFGDAYGEPL